MRNKESPANSQSNFSNQLVYGLMLYIVFTCHLSYRVWLYWQSVVLSENVSDKGIKPLR